MKERRSRVGGWPIAIVGVVLVLVAYTLRYTLVPFVFAMVIGFVLDPVVDWSTRWTMGRRWPMAVLLTVLIVGGCGFGAYWAADTAFYDLSKVAARLPDMLRRGIGAITGPQGVTLMGTHYAPQQITSLIITGATSVFNAAVVLLAIKISIGTIAAVVMTFVLVPYFLISGPHLAEGALWLVPPERQRPVREMLPKLIPMLRHYAAGLCGVVAYAGAMAYVGLGAVFHVPAAALLSVVIGFLELIPVVGPITSIVLVALSAAQIGTFTAVFLVLYALALRLSIDNLVGPLLLGQAVTIHPVVVIFAFIIGAVLFGVIGLLLAVPTAASIKLILEHYYSEPIADDEPVRWPERGTARPS
jgi:predicted PurR-regulated permease PerM